jgi:hypothetical protein
MPVFVWQNTLQKQNHVMKVSMRRHHSIFFKLLSVFLQKETCQGFVAHSTAVYVLADATDVATACRY